MSTREVITGIDADPRQPDTRRTSCPGIRSSICRAGSLSVRGGLTVIVDHEVYSTEPLEPGEGPAPSLIPPSRTSPG
jgi:hypothetical protein